MHRLGVLLQGDHPTAFFSKALNGHNRLLSAYDRELLALVLSVNKWKGYLLGQQFIARTDHHSLRHFWQQKITTLQQEKWLIKQMAYDFIITYKKGKENVVDDFSTI